MHGENMEEDVKHGQDMGKTWEHMQKTWRKHREDMASPSSYPAPPWEGKDALSLLSLPLTSES